MSDPQAPPRSPASSVRFCPTCDATFDVARTRCPHDGSLLLWQRRVPDLIGRTLAKRFVVLSELGRGGMGAVYIARQTSVGREVALKVMQRDGDLDASRRFVREARLAASLAHPNIVSVIDFGQDDDGLLFIAMELLHGLGLDTLMDDGPMPWPRAVRVATQICDALAFAHQRGVIHRDLKPQNVIVVDPHPERDTLKVLDFGLAKSLDPNQSTLTREGVVFGTPAYLSPEMIEGREVGPGADLYALGIMLFEMLEGRVPFEGESLHEIAMKHLTEPPPPITAKVPTTLISIIRRLLAKDPADRFKTTTALREALLSIDSPPSTSAPSVSAPSVEAESVKAESVEARFIAPSRTLSAPSVEAESVEARFIAPSRSVVAESVDARSVDARFIAPSRSVEAESVEARFIAPSRSLSPPSVEARSVEARFIAPSRSVDARSVEAESVDARFIAPSRSLSPPSVDARFIAPSRSVTAPSVDARFIAPSRSVSARFIAPIALVLSVSGLLTLWLLTRDHEPTPPTATAPTLTTPTPPASLAAQPTTPTPTPLATTPDLQPADELTPDTRLDPTPDPLPTPSTEIVWVLEGTARARVTLDGEPAGTTPLTLRLEPRPRQRTLRFTRQGYQPAVRVLPGDKDATLRVILTPEESFIVPDP